MKFIYSDGGRSKYFKTKDVRDCVVRAICNATGKDYKEVYDAINSMSKSEHIGKRKRGVSSARNGVYKNTCKKYIENVLGWKWISCSGIGEGISVHLRESELPSKGSYIIRVSKHLTCIKDGVLYDTYDCSRGGDRAVYGYWRIPTDEEQQEQDYAKKLIEKENNHIKETKALIEQAKLKYKPQLDKLAKKIRELNHQLVLETNKMNREIKKIKNERSKLFIDRLLESN